MINKEPSPWSTISRESVYANDWIEVLHHDVINPAGQEGIYGVVHFKNRAVGILPIDQDRNVWLVGQYRFPLDSYSWEIPEGGCSKVEIPLEAAKRELLEETGIQATDWSELLRTHLSNSVSDEAGIIYVARGLTIGEASPEETEQLKLRKVSLDFAMQMVMNGEITDSLSMLAITKFCYLEEKNKKHTAL